jgi:hypothetical protein
MLRWQPPGLGPPVHSPLLSCCLLLLIVLVFSFFNFFFLVIIIVVNFTILELVPLNQKNAMQRGIPAVEEEDLAAAAVVVG